nr:hypothetical protein BaRGS_029572 [Batillaria attramentaria]
MEGTVRSDRDSGKENATMSDGSQSLSPFEKVERRKRNRNSPTEESRKKGKRARRQRAKTGGTPRQLGSPARLSDSSSSLEGELDRESEEVKKATNQGKAEAKADPNPATQES